MESDVEMCDGEERRRRSKEMKGLCFSFFFFSLIFLYLFIPLFAMVAHLFAFRTAKRVESRNHHSIILIYHIEPDLKNGGIFGATAPRPYFIRERQGPSTAKTGRG